MGNIKFRAWDKRTEQMFQNDLFLAAGRELVIFAKRMRPNMHDMENAKGGLLLATDDDNLVFMQYTGLLDKNGKEIYEGDIVKVFIQGGYSQHFCDQEYKKVVSYDKKGACWNPFNRCRMWVDDNGNLKAVEVIGNIYENPDLKWWNDYENK